MRTVYGLFDSYKSANEAVIDLLNQGHHRKEIGIITKQNALSQEKVMRENLDDGATEGAGVGAVIGGVTGLLAGVGAITIPGLGPILAAGPFLTTLASMVAGASIGAVSGSLVGLLVDWGIPDDVATTYSRGVSEGDILVAIQVRDPEVTLVETTLAQHGGRDINVYELTSQAAQAH